MGHIDFKTDGVEYRLILGTHFSQSKSPIDGLDALVVETGAIDPRDYAQYLRRRREISGYLEEVK